MPKSSSMRRLAPRFGRGALAVAVLAACTLALAGPAHRFGLVDFTTSFTLMRWAVFAAAAAALIALVGLALALWRGPKRALPVALLGLGLAVGTIAVPAYLLQQARSVPPINDITTDTEDPPAFEALLPLREDAPNPAAYAGAQVAAQQEAAYPEIQPVRLDLPPDQAFQTALAAAEAMGWDIVSADHQERRIEATAQTFWFGFIDDVVVRVRPADEGSRLDVRSTSRVGVSDLGTNAARIRAYFAEVRDRIAGSG